MGNDFIWFKAQHLIIKRNVYFLRRVDVLSHTISFDLNNVGTCHVIIHIKFLLFLINFTVFNLNINFNNKENNIGLIIFYLFKVI